MHLRRSFRIVVPIVTAFASVGCASELGSKCGPGQDASISELLYFGRATPNGPTVTAEEWTEFLAASVTPRFPRGITVWQAAGQWKGTDGSVIREPSFVLNLVHPDSQSSEDAIRAVVADYKARFNQEAVLRVKSYACASF
jgi:hypothetical protein